MFLQRIVSIVLAFGALLCAASHANAITVTNLGLSTAIWPVSPNVETYDTVATPNNTDNGVGAASFRPNVYQSFQYSGPTITVDKFYLSLRARGNTGPYTIQISPMTNTLAAGNGPSGVGSAIFTSGTLSAGGADTGLRTWEFSLSGGEQFSLPAATSPAGYIIRLSTTDTQPVWSWGARDPGSYALGRGYQDGGSAGDNFSNTDFAFALSGSETVPEPSTYALGLIGLAGLGLVAWRKNRIPRC